MHWLAVNADAMNVDNNPRDDFEKDAVQALASKATCRTCSEFGTRSHNLGGVAVRSYR